MTLPEVSSPGFCPVCESADLQFVLEQAEARYFARRIFRCRTCGVGFVFPAPSPEVLAEIYSRATYFEEHRGDDRRSPGWERARLRVRFIRALMRRRGRIRARPPDLLEVGPGNGEFLLEARSAGWTVEGLELSSRWAETLSARTGIRVTSADSLASYPVVKKFDVIAMWEVVEHYRDPLNEIRFAFEYLQPGGLLALSTPNYGSLRARIYGARWRGFWEGWEHLFFFAPDSLAILLKRAGFTSFRFVTRKINAFLLKPLEYMGLGNVLEAYACKPE
ncbi:MAG: class I SAM-dependent methyltransferase [bacterium JZ-2024 1]